MLLQKLALELDLFEILPWLPITLRTEVRLVRVMHTALYDHLLLPVHLDFPQSFFTPGATILSNKVKVCDNVSFRCSCNWWSILHLASFSFLILGQREFPGGQVVKDLVLSLLWFGFEFWSRDLICVLQAWLKEKKKKKQKLTTHLFGGGVDRGNWEMTSSWWVELYFREQSVVYIMSCTVLTLCAFYDSTDQTEKQPFFFNLRRMQTYLDFMLTEFLEPIYYTMMCFSRPCKCVPLSVDTCSAFLLKFEFPHPVLWLVDSSLSIYVSKPTSSWKPSLTPKI